MVRLLPDGHGPQGTGEPAVTREPHPRRNGRYIDRGHYGRKVVFWTAVAAYVLLLAIPYGLALLVVGALDFLADRLLRVKNWAHPCLGKRLPKLPAPDLAPEWKARVPETHNEEKP